jgi:methoxymalonate biosynthesis protein
MGAGIAATAAGHGLAVVVFDIDPDVLAQASARIGEQLRHASLLGALPADVIPGRVTTTMCIDDAADVTVVVEAVTEDLASKVKAFNDALAVVGPSVPLVSNTSGIPIDEMATKLPQPDRLIGTHFMNPPYLIEQVEVIRGCRTSPATMAGLRDFLSALHRRPVVVRDTPGFVTSRLLHPMLNDAASVVGEGIADAKTVDELMQGCLGHRTGPLRTADLIGLDNLADSLDALYERTGEVRYRPCPQLRSMVRKGELGRKSGKGFYDYEGGAS